MGHVRGPDLHGSKPSSHPSSNFCSGEIITSSARHDNAGFEPPSWVSLASESVQLHLGQLPRILTVESAPCPTQSWETFYIPSIPPSPVDSVPYPDMYDDAMIKMHGRLPAEWVAYAHRHCPGSSRI
ncbi:hypothetical protein RSAG8_13614, partial [Rhizoctonia solani AG-8 WAC10335]